MKEFLHHDEGILYDEGRPIALTYNVELKVEEELIPFENHGSIDIQTQEGHAMNYLLPISDLDHHFVGQSWSPDSPVHVSYRASTDLSESEQMNLVDPEPLKKFIDKHFERPSSTPATEVAQWLSEEFDYVRNSTFDREDFLEEREGQCDQFAEIMSLFNPNWIKHQGYARPGDYNLPEDKMEFTDHAWVVDTRNETIYDPAPLISHNMPPEWIERNTDVYFLQLPRIQVLHNGEKIPEAIRKYEEDDVKNFDRSHNVEQVR